MRHVTNEQYARFIEELERRLPERTRRHCLSVAEFMASLAERIDIDVGRAVTAGLLHDLCRTTPGDELLLQARQYGLEIGPAQLRKPMLLHGPVAACVSRRELGVMDNGVYEAIYYHTTGRPNLGKLGLALYVADFAEPLRGYPEAAEARSVLDQRGFKACLEFVVETNAGYLDGKEAVDPITVSFRRWVQEEAGA